MTVPAPSSAEVHHHAHSAGATGGGHGMVEVHHLPPPWQPAMERPKLPVGAALVALLIAIVGMVLLIAGVLFVLNAYGPGFVPSGLLIFHALDVVGAAILIVLGAVMLGLASALWDQELWALYTTVAVVFAALTYEFFTGSITVLFLVLLVLFVYLLAVRRHFF